MTLFDDLVEARKYGLRRVISDYASTRRAITGQMIYCMAKTLEYLGNLMHIERQGCLETVVFKSILLA